MSTCGDSHCDYCGDFCFRCGERHGENHELREALTELVARCDGAEGVRADGSNIQTVQAHAVLAKARAR